jgi:CheY-like chemotaxis protein
MASILIVDDSGELSEATAVLLRDAGYSVDTASNGRAAAQMYRAKHHDLVLTDIVIPDTISTGKSCANVLVHRPV